ncbi:MAG: bifunctional riboflavin kinase/FAD synthetase, partial [Gammaproteobacteria bacterium]|nr:bifunctional riboflavin kinase/FAD synthetase [Gammaproteobacteria bacterium]
PVIVTFEPYPMEFFAPERAPARLTDFRQKLELLSVLGVDKVICLRFNESLASVTAQAFVEDVLVRKLNVKGLIVGEDFRFGNNREGNIDLLRKMSEKNKFELIPAETFHYNGKRVSSSLVRGHLAIGDFNLVRELLGRPYRIDGTVIHGDKRGRELGYPTANIACRRVNYPLSGVFVVRIHGLNDTIHDGVASIGTRPVFDGEDMLLEVNLFDFQQDIYGKRISVEFCKKLRDEQQFHSVEALCEQMATDVKKSREYFLKNMS